MRPTAPRLPHATGPLQPSAPFPITVSGPIVKGFGRGSAELGIPTANIPLAGLSVGGHSELESGVYYGWAGVGVDGEGRRKEKEGDDDVPQSQAQQQAEVEGEGGKEQDGDDDGIPVPGGTIYPMVMSLGYNPYYKNTVRSIEVHILHRFSRDFYGARMNLILCGFIRPEYDYVSKESLVEDIRVDIVVAGKSLEREGYRALLRDEDLFRRLTDFTPIGEAEAAEANANGNGEVDGKL